MDRDDGFESDLDAIRELLQKYGLQQFENMVHIASRSLYEPSMSSSSRASIMSSAATSISRGTSSGYSLYTDTSSLRSQPTSMYMPSLPVRSSTTSVLSRTSTPGGSALTPDVPGALPDATTLADPDADGPGDGSRTKLQCPFCTEYHIGQWIGRKPDLKRHFLKIHASNAQWTCRLGGGCNLTFDFHTAYDTHVKKEHGGVKDQEAKVDLCQQVVWACGFETCREVFEAKTDSQGPKVMNNYFEHVLGHVVSSACGRWSYIRRMRNLLHQELVRHAWKDCDKGLRDELVWQPQSSSTLRKMLETRHIGDAMLLCKYAVLLGQGHPAPSLPPFQFGVPELSSCKVVSASHDPRQDSRLSKGGGLLSFGRKSSAKPSAPRPSGRITGSQPKSRINVLRSPQPQQAMLVPASAIRSPPPVPPIPSSLRSPAPMTSQHQPLHPQQQQQHQQQQHQHQHPHQHQQIPHMPSSTALNMFATSAPQLQPLPTYTSPSEYPMVPADTTTSLGFSTHQSSLPDLDFDLYSGYQSIAEPPSIHQYLGGGAKDNGNNAQHQGILQHNLTQHYAQKALPLHPSGAGDRQQQQQHQQQHQHQQHHSRPRRNSSPGSDYRMGGESPVAGFAQPFPPQPGRNEQLMMGGGGGGGRRRSSTTMDFVYAS